MPAGLALANCFQEYNASAPAPSPRLTRAQRRKSLAVDRSMALEAGLAKAALAEEEEEEEEDAAAQQAVEAVVQQQQQPKKSAGRRKSMSAAVAVQQQVAEQEEQEQVVPLPQPPQQQAAPRGLDSVAAEVAALNAAMCATLDGMLEDSPEKKPRCAYLQAACEGSVPFPQAACAFFLMELTRWYSCACPWPQHSSTVPTCLPPASPSPVCRPSLCPAEVPTTAPCATSCSSRGMAGPTTSA